MLFQCWASIEDGGPTLKQHCVNTRVCCIAKWSRISIQLLHHTMPGTHDTSTQADINLMFVKCWASVAGAGHIAGSMGQ